MHRRNFIKVTAATTATATLAGCGNPENELIRLIPEEPILPGIATLKPSICPLCSAGCGLQVRVVDGDAEVVREGRAGLIRMGLPRKLEGNPTHPVNQGKLCARGQAAIQITYHPDRIRQPLRKKRGEDSFEPIGWEQAIAELTAKLEQLAASNRREGLAFLSRPLRGQRQALVSAFTKGFGGRDPLTFEVFSDQVLREAHAESFGRRQLPTFDLSRARYVLSFGADFLGTWNSPVTQSIAYGDFRQGRAGVRGKFVQIESRMSQTGANADEWIPVNPGTEGVLALGLAHVILRDKPQSAASRSRATKRIKEWDQGLPSYTPAEVERRTGVPRDRIEKLAREFAENSPGVAIIGGVPLGHTNGTFQALAVNALNALAGTVDKPGGLFFTSQFGGQQAANSVPFEKLVGEILSAAQSPVDALLLYEANPVFGTPRAWRVREAIEKIPYIVSFGNFIDETSIHADLILPDHSFLESWVDDVPETGPAQAAFSVAAPAMSALHNTRSMPDVLLQVSRQLSQHFQPELPWQSYEEMIRDSFLRLPGATEASWADAQKAGWWTIRESRALSVERETQSETLEIEPRFDGTTTDYPFHFMPYPSQAFLDGSLAHLPWLQEMPDVISTAMWSSWVEIHPQTASSLGVIEGDLVEVASQHGSVRAPALISPGIAPNLIAMPVGQGHETFTRYASGRGANPIAILAPLTDKETGALAWAATRVRVSKAGGKGELVLFAGGMKEHDARQR